MEDKSNFGTRQQTSQFDLDGSTEFMLNEIEYARQGIYFYVQRFESQVTYFLAGLAAIASASAVF